MWSRRDDRNYDWIESSIGDGPSIGHWLRMVGSQGGMPMQNLRARVHLTDIKDFLDYYSYVEHKNPNLSASAFGSTVRRGFT